MGQYHPHCSLALGAPARRGCPHHTSLQDGGGERLPDPMGRSAPLTGDKDRSYPLGTQRGGQAQKYRKADPPEKGKPWYSAGCPHACRARTNPTEPLLPDPGFPDLWGARARRKCLNVRLRPPSQQGLQERPMRPWKPVLPHRWSTGLLPEKEAGRLAVWKSPLSYSGIYLKAFSLP